MSLGYVFIILDKISLSTRNLSQSMRKNSLSLRFRDVTEMENCVLTDKVFIFGHPQIIVIRY